MRSRPVPAPIEIAAEPGTAAVSDVWPPMPCVIVSNVPPATPSWKQPFS